MAGSKPPERWEKTATEIHSDCRIFEVLKSRFKHPVRQLEGDFYVLDAPDWITVVATTERQELVTVRQFRFGIEDLSLEVPAGLMEIGEEPMQTAIRELREETGFVGQNVEILGWVHPNPAIQSNRCYVIGIHEVERLAETDWDEHEEIETRLIPLPEVQPMLANGLFSHALSVCALQFYFLKYPL